MEDEEEILLAILGRPRKPIYLDIGPPNEEERAMFQARLDAIKCGRESVKTSRGQASDFGSSQLVDAFPRF
jgi:hypothetical protein